MEWPCRWLWEAKREHLWMLSWLLWDRFLLGKVMWLCSPYWWSFSGMNFPESHLKINRLWRSKSIVWPWASRSSKYLSCAWILVFIPSHCLTCSALVWQCSFEWSWKPDTIYVCYSTAAWLHYMPFLMYENSWQCWKILSQKGGGGGEAGIHFCHILFLLIENKHSFIPVSKLLYLKFLILKNEFKIINNAALTKTVKTVA